MGGCNQFEINNSTLQPSPGSSTKPTTKPTPNPTPKPTPEPTPKPGLQCLKCNDIPNPGNPNPDACDADQHFGDLTTCSDELVNATGPVYCFVQQLTVNGSESES